MIKVARKKSREKWVIIIVFLFFCFGMGTTGAMAAAPYVPVFSTNNNLSCIDATGAATGGANDILFTWDGTLKTSVAVSGQIANATIGLNGANAQTPCLTGTGGTAWKAHDVAVYAPGTYTVYASCSAKAPGCAGGTNPITFTVRTGEIGVHMLVDWGTVAANRNIDVVNVWTPGVFGPSPLWTGACGSNSTNKIWDLMSKDSGTGINGYAMVDGPFVGTRWNFNMMGAPINMVVDTSNNNVTMLDEAGAVTGGANNVRFTWDGTRKTSVAASRQVANATMSSSCPFTSRPWWAHDAVIYSTGTYTVFAGCAAGSPGCGTGTPIIFTVAPDELGVHFLVDWGTNRNIDVVNVWKLKSEFGPSPLWTGACGSNSANKIWDLMSKDPGTDVNGYAMVDGPFIGTRWNFNVTGVPVTMVVDTSKNNVTTLDRPGSVTSGTAAAPRLTR